LFAGSFFNWPQRLGLWPVRDCGSVDLSQNINLCADYELRKTIKLNPLLAIAGVMGCVSIIA